MISMLRHRILKYLAQDDIAALEVDGFRLCRGQDNSSLTITFKGPAKDVARLANSVGWFLVVRGRK
jgi:hypothetical protein